ASDLLKAQNYEVIEEIKVTGAELDLLCKHNVSGKKIYVECKAQKEKIGAPILRQLLGTVIAYDYTEGWIISTAEFGKEAKGFIDMFKQKPGIQATQLSFYSPELIITTLSKASIIVPEPIERAKELTLNKFELGDWVLLISKYGKFWCVYILMGGVPNDVLVFCAKKGSLITDKLILENLKKLKSSIAEFSLNPIIETNKKDKENHISINLLPTVIEVQTGESWIDYRPARPEDFVGRDRLQTELLDYLKDIQNKKLRIFAITGNSGLGKSSLIAKLRDRSRNQHYRKRIFIFAVDIRGARNTAYIHASLLECLRQAQKNNFGDQIELQITNPDAPLNSPQIIDYLNSLEQNQQTICLVFDQFEELYSKVDLFDIFKTAKNLMLDVAGIQKNFVLGFAWKTDSTTQQDHPAYYMWHELSDYRIEYKLDVFTNGEIAKSLTKFEKSRNKKLPIEIRHQLTESSQGFPWLLKKLCINLTKSNRKDNIIDLDVTKLFEDDLEKLTPQQLTCLKIIAHNAPADWSEIIELSSVNDVNALVNQRLVIKSGDRLNIYWDIFRDYLITGKVPIIPFNYIPTTDPTSIFKVCRALPTNTYLTSESLAELTNLNTRTVWNIGADLTMLGIAERKGTEFKLHSKIQTYDKDHILMVLREKFDKHVVKIDLYKKFSGQSISMDKVKDVVKDCFMRKKHADKTWNVYTNRLVNFLVYTGYLTRSNQDVTVGDLGRPFADLRNLSTQRRNKGKAFTTTISPYKVYEVLKDLKNGTNKNELELKASIVLRRYNLIFVKNDLTYINQELINKHGGVKEALWAMAKNEKAFSLCLEILKEQPNIDRVTLAKLIAQRFNLTWAESSLKRNGNIFLQWSSWIKEGLETSLVPVPPGKRGD
ncbi:restriction endonuclease, partial [Proteus mirabilis]